MIAVNYLDGADLALWVARAMGHREAFRWQDHAGKTVVYMRPTDQQPFMPHEDWKDGGPLIDQFGIDLTPADRCREEYPRNYAYQAQAWSPYVCQQGHTALVAICRCVVHHVFGKEVPDA